MDGVELAALYTLQHRLPRNAEDAHGVIHGHESLGRFFDEAGSQLLGHADTPGRTWGKLLSGNDSVVEPTMDRGGRHAQTLGNLMHGQQLCAGCFGNGLVAGDAPVRAEAGDAIGGETQPGGGPATLAVEDAGDEGVGIVFGQSPHQVYGLLGRAVGGHPRVV